MFISKIKLINFKSFKGEHVIEFSEGVNFFVGNNNCGKTTIFKAIEFIQSGKNKSDFITQGLEAENISVELEFKGADLSEIVNDENGILVPAKNPGALAGAIDKLATDVPLRNRLAFHAKKTYEERFSYSMFLENYRELYREIQGEPK